MRNYLREAIRQEVQQEAGDDGQRDVPRLSSAAEMTGHIRLFATYRNG